LCLAYACPIYTCSFAACPFAVLVFAMSDFPPDSPMIDPIEQSIQQQIDALRSQVQWDVMADWQWVGDDLHRNAKGHIAWPKGRQAVTLSQTITLPERVQHYPLTGMTARLALTWWAETARVYVNGQLVQEGDLFDHSARIYLSHGIVPGETITVRIELVSPVHDAGALMRSPIVVEAADGGIDPGFVADELAVIFSYLKAFQADRLREFSQILAADLRRDTIDFTALRDRLQVYCPAIKQYQISLLGHAHLDMVWLWNLAETWRAADRTFTSALALQQDFPELIFCHTTPLLYEWLAAHRPQLFAAIQAQVQLGQWEVLGGMWIEPELNLINAESIARQILYGQRYYQRHFGQISAIAWLPDTFGFCNQLPQLLKQGGMDYFVTQKFRWNDTNQYPHELFDWQAPDGSTVMALMSAPIGEGIDPIKLANYCWEWQQRTGHNHALWLPGVGDHGGGPTRDMLAIARRWQQSPFFPTLAFTSAIDYLHDVDTATAMPLAQSKTITQTETGPAAIVASTDDRRSTVDRQLASRPIHSGDLYLEFHRGCYTTHADQKAFNRDCENSLYAAELWSSIAAMLGQQPYPQTQLETAWKQVLLNQFHDILPGTSIREVYEDADPAWRSALQSSRQISMAAMAAIAQLIALPEFPTPEAIPIVVFNPLGWARSQVVRIMLPAERELPGPIGWQIIHTDGAVQTAYVEPDAKYWENLWVEFPIADVPAFGYRLVWLVQTEQSLAAMDDIVNDDPNTIENEFLRVTIDSETGDIAMLWDKVNHRSVFSEAANQIELFQDSGQYWDAWNIDPKYEMQPLPPSQHFDVVRMESLYIQELWAVGQGGSRAYILEQGTPWLKIKAQLNGDERHVLRKACFPLNFTADHATYETAGGVIQRPTRPTTAAEKAQWEVSGLRWADMSSGGNENDYGVSILSDRKHGYDHQPHQIRLTLLRGSEWPDPEADKGNQSFSYGIYPHRGDWKTGLTPQTACEFSQPLQAFVLPLPDGKILPTLPPIGSLLDCGSGNVILMALKQSEDDATQFILRVNEIYGESTSLMLSGLVMAQWTVGDRVDLLERSIVEASPTDIQPWQIASIQLQPLT
jgi:alpha-mannosidase